MTENRKMETSSDYIEEAFFLLLEKKSFSSLRIQEITQKAGVSRVTFYRNYQSKKDIILRYFQKKEDRFIELYGRNENPLASENVIRYIFTSFQEEKERLQALERNDLLYLYLDFLDQELTIGQNKRTEKPSYLSHFFSGALYNISLHWLRNDCKEDIDFLVSEVMKACDILRGNK